MEDVNPTLTYVPFNVNEREVLALADRYTYAHDDVIMYPYYRGYLFTYIRPWFATTITGATSDPLMFQLRKSVLYCAALIASHAMRAHIDTYLTR